MERYDFAEVSFYNKVVYLHCTGSLEADTFFSQLKSLFPKMQIGTGKLPSGNVISYYLMYLPDAQVPSVVWWIMEQLCSHGWEPIGAASGVWGDSVSTTTTLHYQFKRRTME